MHPVLFDFPDWLPLIGDRDIRVYGFMIAMGFLCGMWWVKRESRLTGLNADRNMDLFFYMMISGLVGSRIFYVFNSVPNFWSDPLVFFRIWDGGLVFQGGVILCVIVAFFVVKKYKIPFFKTGDVFMPALCLGHGLGRIGCFFAGCCYGEPCDPRFPLALIFPHSDKGIAPAGIPLYPTQLMEIFGEALIFAVLFIFRKKKPFDGAVFLLYIILYSVLRSITEAFRGDVIRGFVVEPYMSNGRFISLIAVILSVLCWMYLAKKARVSKI
ncbi:MAG: prolipoprotein diacylglyceryl transferase [Deltaproteobacteria bacterium]|nr:prolipoprotein diacylglyceryl transferase [Deltaproteobacteria bacterium]